MRVVILHVLNLCSQIIFMFHYYLFLSDCQVLAPNNQIDVKGHRGMNMFFGYPEAMSLTGVGL